MAASEEIYEVEQILAKRQSRRGIEYLIRWKGYDNSWDTWEPVANLGDAMDIVEEFNDRMALNQLMGVKQKGPLSAIKRVSGKTTLSPPAKKQTKSPQAKPGKTQAQNQASPNITKVKTPKKKKTNLTKESEKIKESGEPPVVPSGEPEAKESDDKIVKPKKNAPKGKKTKPVGAKANLKTGKAKVVSTKATKNSNTSKAVGKSSKKVAKKAAPGSKSKTIKAMAKDAVADIEVKVEEDSMNEKVNDKVIKPKKTGAQKRKAGGISVKAATSEPSSKKLPKKNSGVKRKKPSVMDTPSDDSSDDDDDILYSINEDFCPKTKKRKKTSGSESPDLEVTFQKVVSPGKKILLKDSMKSKTKIVKPVPRMPVSPSRVRSPIFLSEVPSSPYKTPPSSPSSISPATHHLAANLPAHGREAPQGKEFFLSDLPAVPVIPVIPSSPSAASYKKVLAKSYPPDTQKVYANHAAESSVEDESEESAERRMSVRQSECVFRYKEIVVRKCRGYTQVWLFTQTKIKNCLNPAVLSELKQVLQNAKYDDSRLVIISGSGSIFCSGVDLHYLQNGNRKQAAENMAEAIRDFISTVISFPKLLVAAVNGPAIGLGVSILPLFDIIYASDKASFYCPYARLAQTPEACASYTFPSIMGNAMANEMLLGGRKLTAIEAYQIGLVSQVFWPTSMMQQVMPRVQNLVMYSAKALEQSKMLIRSHQKSKMEFTNESECRMLSERWSSPECHKAIKEYLEDEQDILV